MLPFWPDPHSHGIDGDDLSFGMEATDHLHLMPQSDATDSDHDGFSDAAEVRLHTDPFDAYSHPSLDASWLPHAHSCPGDMRDTDGDGFPDALERGMSMDPLSTLSHPDVTLAHHFPEGSGVNLPGTIDIVPPLPEWHLP